MTDAERAIAKVEDFVKFLTKKASDKKSREMLAYDCGHTSHGLRKEYDLLAAKGSISTGVELTWSSAILCETCKTSINNNPDDPREVYPAGTREDQ